ncbi:hypothetical protein [Pseudobacteroides cellulosolvens]|uniref:Uncharacterized protein n=1 Tax=Pseudobacteroides cellulosolvens ATCC 35603 = DSM 2933 TaxID=398512 RepID=A0A0L6JVH7_9FIRM|nr:hypothetical protein [Pseudobacteroides cellulosolvens]KNY29833.1 hypothetical protein Bccel_5110 [Pseudobacteroides cellulosolvens ATCC 35603 = DSM 2933]
MENNTLHQNSIKISSFLSILLPTVLIVLILNWLFKITPFQKLQGMPLLITPPICLVGFFLAYTSYKKSSSLTAKLGIAFNSTLFLLPFLYWTLGTAIFGT